MWLSFWFAVIVAVFVLYVPGYFAMRSFGFSSDISIVLSPLVTAGIMSVVGEGLSRATALSPAIFWIVVTLFCGMCYYFEYRKPKFHVSTNPLDLRLLLPYIVLGIVAGIVTFVSVVETPEHISQSVDMVHHIGAIRSFIVSGKFSSLKQGTYMLAQDQAICPWKGLSFYPSAYHIFVAIVSSCAKVNVPIAINATNIAFSSIVYPTSMYALINTIFSGDKKFVLAGSIFTSAFTIFPWGFMVYGPLIPNLAAFAAMPALFATFMLCWMPDYDEKQRFKAIEAFLISALGLAMLHPSAIFTSAIFLMPYCVMRLMKMKKSIEVFKIHINRYMATGILLVLWLAFFIAAANTSAVKLMGTFDWGVTACGYWARRNIFRVSYVGSFYTCPVEYLIGYSVLIGVIYSIYKKREVWCVASYGLICYLLYVNATSSGAFKHFIGAFWYTDPYRFGAMASIFAVPVATLGVVGIVDLIRNILNRLHAQKVANVLLSLLLIFTLWVSYAPLNKEIGTYNFICGGKLEYPLGVMREQLRRDMNLCEPYSDSERQFVEECQEKIEPDSLVINIPRDGSMYAYGVSGLRTYYRPLKGYGDDKKEEETSKTIRLHLCDYATNKEVQDAVKKIDAKYVLQLIDKTKAPEKQLEDPQYYNFDGIKAIDPQTKGFELVYHKDNMYLYKIVR